MNRRLLALAAVASLAGAFALLACVGDTPVTPTPDAGPADSGGDVDVKPDANADAAPPLLTCQAGETLETFEDPMNASSNVDLCWVTSPSCDQAVANGLSYSGGVFKAAVTVSAPPPFGIAFSYRGHEAFSAKLTNVVEAITTFELTVDAVTTPDGGWQSVGCLLDLTDTAPDGGFTFISRTEIATNGSTGSAFTFANGNRAGGSTAALTGYPSTLGVPMDIVIRLDRRATTKASVSLTSAAGSGSINLSPVAASKIGLSCGVGHEGFGTTKATMKKIRYARCLKP